MSVLVVGSLNIDLVTVTIQGLPKPGETLMGKSKGIYFGGKGANQAVAAARLRGDVQMIGAVGKDDDGQRIINALQKEGVDHSGIVVRGDQSGFASVTVCGTEGENTVIVIPGANGLLSAKDLRPEAFGMAKVVLCQNEVPLSVTYEAFRCARQVGRLTFWNPAPAPDNECADVLGFVDVLCVNESEARAVSGLADLDNALKNLVDKVPTVIVTLGKRGCMLLQRGKDIVRIPAAPVEKVLDTTGAGDCFCGSLALFLSRGIPLADAAKMANEVAAISVTMYGAQASYPTLHECPKHIQRALGRDSTL